MSGKYTPKIPCICHTSQLIHVQIPDNYVSVYASYKLKAIKTVATSTGVHTFT